MKRQRQRILAVLVENRAGVLSRVAGMFSRRGFNIDSIAVGQAEDPRYARMTIVVRGDEDDVEQVTKQLHKIIDVIRVSDLTDDDMVERELVLVKVSAGSENRAEILQIVDIFRARIIDVSERSLIVEATGDSGKVDAMVNMLRPFGIKELVRTGRVAMARGTQATQPVEHGHRRQLEAI